MVAKLVFMASLLVGGWWWLGGQGWDFFPGFFVG